MKVLEIDITKQHIRTSMAGEKKHCAIANAIKESDDNIAGASVDRHYIEIFYHTPEKVDRYRSSKLVSNFVTDFDNNRSPKPFRLAIDDNDWVSSRPRQMRQREKRDEILRRRSYAVATGQPLREVYIEDVPSVDAFGDDGFATTKSAHDRVTRKAKPSGNRRKYAKRETASQVFQVSAAKRQ